MKIKISHRQLIIMSIIILALFVARSDVKVVYDKSVSRLSNYINTLKNNNVNNKQVVKSEKILKPQSTVETPGALEVKTGLANNAGKVDLSIEGVINMTNKNRTLNGNMKPLIENSKLDFSAQLKLQDMFKQQYFEHISPDGVGVADLSNKVSYDYIVIGENLALGNFKDATSLLDAWMSSPGHRANILNKKYTDIGVAVGHSMYHGQDVWMAVQHFGLPRSVCPAIDEILHSDILLEENDIRTMEKDLIARKQRIDTGIMYNGMSPNEQVTEYNNLVSTYNQMILKIKSDIDQYNNEVTSFNNCLTTNTSN